LDLIHDEGYLSTDDVVNSFKTYWGAMMDKKEFLKQYKKELIFGCVLSIVLIILVIFAVNTFSKEETTEEPIREKPRAANIDINQYDNLDNSFTTAIDIDFNELDKKIADGIAKGLEKERKRTKEDYIDPKKIINYEPKARRLFLDHIKNKNVYVPHGELQGIYNLVIIREAPVLYWTGKNLIYEIEQKTHMQLTQPETLRENGKQDIFHETILCTVDIEREKVTGCNIPFEVDYSNWLIREPELLEPIYVRVYP